MERVALVAMAPSGETFIVRDPARRLWLIPPPGAGDSELVDTDQVDRAVAFGGFERVGEEFDSWEDLDRRRLERVAPLVPAEVVDRDQLDRHDVEEMLDVARRWAAGGEHARARRAVLALLQAPVSRTDDALHDRLVGSLE